MLVNGPVANSEPGLDELFSRAGSGAPVAIDQARNIGSLAIRRARMAGLDVAYLPGTAMHEASKLFAGEAKTDVRDTTRRPATAACWSRK